MRSHSLLRALLLVTLLGVLSFPALADELTGTIRGVVTDPSGAIIPKAAVKATNSLTGISVQAVSASDGSFEFLHLQAPAVYSVSVRADGFKNFEAQGIHLALNQIYVLRVALEVGTVSQQVVVEAAATQVEQTSMQLGAELTSRDATELPLIGRELGDPATDLAGDDVGFRPLCQQQHLRHQRLARAVQQFSGERYGHQRLAVEHPDVYCSAPTRLAR